MNKKLVGESVAEFDYQPHKCGRKYRLVVVRKNISVQRGEVVLFEDIKYFFYITNHTDYRAEQIVALANERCEQENVIEQLKNGVNAMRMPVDDLISNWAYMVMSALAWNLLSKPRVLICHSADQDTICCLGSSSGTVSRPVLGLCSRSA